MSLVICTWPSCGHTAKGQCRPLQEGGNLAAADRLTALEAEVARLTAERDASRRSIQKFHRRVQSLERWSHHQIERYRGWANYLCGRLHDEDAKAAGAAHERHRILAILEGSVFSRATYPQYVRAALTAEILKGPIDEPDLAPRYAVPEALAQGDSRECV